MEENNNEEKVTKQETTVNTEELKNETVNTVKQVKETMKNVDIKEEAKATKGFITEIFSNPLGKIKEIANDASNKYFKTAIVLIIVWTIVVLVAALFKTFGGYKIWSWRYMGDYMLSWIKTCLAPVLSIIAMSLVIFLFNKNSKKSLITVITTVTTTKLPVIAASVISLLTLISSNASVITTRVTSVCSVISTVFMYFAIKALVGEEEDNKAIKTFVIVEAIYYVVSLVVYYLGIYI